MHWNMDNLLVVTIPEDSFPTSHKLPIAPQLEVRPKGSIHYGILTGLVLCKKQSSCGFISASTMPRRQDFTAFILFIWFLHYFPSSSMLFSEYWEGYSIWMSHLQLSTHYHLFLAFWPDMLLYMNQCKTKLLWLELKAAHICTHRRQFYNLPFSQITK